MAELDLAGAPRRPLSQKEKEQRRRLKDRDIDKEDALLNLKRPVLPTGWEDDLVEYQLNDGSIGLDDADRFEPVALVRSSNPAAQLWVQRILERNLFYTAYIDVNEQGVVTVLAFSTGDDFLKARLTPALKSAIINELTVRWEDLRQKALISSQRTAAVITGTLDKDKLARPLEPENIYKPGFFAIASTSPGNIPVARFSRGLFENSLNRLECLRDVPCPTFEERIAAYLAEGREGSQGYVAIPFQFWCTEVMRNAGQYQ